MTAEHGMKGAMIKRCIFSKEVIPNGLAECECPTSFVR